MNETQLNFVDFLASMSQQPSQLFASQQSNLDEKNDFEKQGGLDQEEEEAFQQDAQGEEEEGLEEHQEHHEQHDQEEIIVDSDHRDDLETTGAEAAEGAEGTKGTKGAKSSLAVTGEIEKPETETETETEIAKGKGKGKEQHQQEPSMTLNNFISRTPSAVLTAIGEQLHFAEYDIYSMLMPEPEEEFYLELMRLRLRINKTIKKFEDSNFPKIRTGEFDVGPSNSTSRQTWRLPYRENMEQRDEEDDNESVYTVRTETGRKGKAPKRRRVEEPQDSASEFSTVATKEKAPKKRRKNPKYSRSNIETNYFFLCFARYTAIRLISHIIKMIIYKYKSVKSPLFSSSVLKNLALIFSGRALGKDMIDLHQLVWDVLEKKPIETLESFLKIPFLNAYKRGTLNHFAYNMFSPSAGRCAEDEILKGSIPRTKQGLVDLANIIESQSQATSKANPREHDPLYAFRGVEITTLFSTIKASLFDQCNHFITKEIDNPKNANHFLDESLEKAIGFEQESLVEDEDLGLFSLEEYNKPTVRIYKGCRMDY